MQLLKHGTKYTKAGGISYGVPDLVPADPADPGPLYVCVTDPAFIATVRLALKELEQHRAHAAFERDTCYHPGREALKDSVERLGSIINKLKKVIGNG